MNCSKQEHEYKLTEETAIWITAELTSLELFPLCIREDNSQLAISDVTADWMLLIRLPDIFLHVDTELASFVKTVSKDTERLTANLIPTAIIALQ